MSHLKLVDSLVVYSSIGRRGLVPRRLVLVVSGDPITQIIFDNDESRLMRAYLTIVLSLLSVALEIHHYLHGAVFSDGSFIPANIVRL